MSQSNRIAELAGFDDHELNVMAAKLTGKYQERRLTATGPLRPFVERYCTSLDACHRDLIPEIERRGLRMEFMRYLRTRIDDWAFSATPRQLTIAFIATCESGAAHG